MKRSRVHRRRRASRAVIIAALIILIGRIGYQISERKV